jgi:hypothetical protein
MIPQVFLMPLPFYLFWLVSEAFLLIFMGMFWRAFSMEFGVGITHEDVVLLFLVIFTLQICGKAFDLVVFGGVLGKMVLRVDF